jgi:hypothetical protein
MTEEPKSQSWWQVANASGGLDGHCGQHGADGTALQPCNTGPGPVTPAGIPEEGTVSVSTAVQRLVDARSNRRPLAPLSETLGEFTIEHAYTIQDALRQPLDQRGERTIGWKLGATSPAGQAVMGVKEPASGFLLPDQYATGAEVPVSGFEDLRVEAEVAFRMRTKLVGPGVTAAAALLAVESAVPADGESPGRQARGMMLRPRVDAVRAASTIG